MPRTTFFLVDAISREVTPLPRATALAESNHGDTLDMIMSPREVWRVPLAHPFTKTVLRTKHDIGSICFDSDSAEGYYVTAPSQKSPSKLIHLLGSGGERAINLSSGTPVGVVYCLPGRCLTQLDDGPAEEGSRHFHLAWISTATGKRIGLPSRIDDLPVAGRADPICLSDGLVLEYVVPAIEPNSIGGSKLQTYEVQDLAQRKVVGKVKVPYPDGQNAEMGISCSGASRSCFFCVESQEESSSVGKNGVTKSNSRFQRSYYRYSVGTGVAAKLFGDSVPDLSATSGNEWSTACALTNDGHYLVATGRNDGELEIIPIKP